MNSCSELTTFYIVKKAVFVTNNDMIFHVMTLTYPPARYELQA